eukprot:1369298-Amorphochlora_amoeboformis.AAC.1
MKLLEALEAALHGELLTELRRGLGDMTVIEVERLRKVEMGVLVIDLLFQKAQRRNDCYLDRGAIL